MSYLDLYHSGELAKRAAKANQILEDCILCPRHCHVNRWAEKKGFCRISKNVIVSSVGPHFGEEPPLVGGGGSGTIFFAGCNLACRFCQNYHISQLDDGELYSTTELSQAMFSLQSLGCHNINLVTPTHVIPQILAALLIAVEKGLEVPLVYNCGGYEALETLELLDGVVDIYMPDAKYGGSIEAREYSQAPEYPVYWKSALREMYRQVGDLVIDSMGVARRGLLVRHLVLPNGLAGSKEILHYIAADISRNTYVNIMEQYRPCYLAHEIEVLNRRISAAEYEEVIAIARKEGLWRGF